MQPAKKTILIVEDEPHIVLGLQDALEFEGFRVLSAPTGQEGLLLARRAQPDAVILDLMLPDTNGYAVCAELRQWSAALPIVMLTARSQETDKIRGLDAGADDYVTKPFSINELVARIRAVLRRTQRSVPSTVPERFDIGAATVCFDAHAIVREGEEQQLSVYELELLKLLVERAGHPVSRDEILQRVWGLDANPSNRTVDNFIVKLRKKIEAIPDKPQHILTVYGFGYKLVLGEAAPRS